MAQKRMFDKNVVNSDKFLDLPNSSKALYFMAGMDADDKGFFQPRKLQRMCGFSDDDFKLLIAKGFFITFESGVMVVTDWNKNNWLDSRRITETEYIDELNLLKLINQKYEFKTPDDFAKQSLSQNSIVENSIVQNSIEERKEKYIKEKKEEKDDVPLIYETIEKNFNRTLSPIEITKISDWLSFYSEDVIEYAIEKAVMQNKKNFNYVVGILNNWKSSGYKTLNEIKQISEEFKQNKNENNSNLPKWFGKEVEADEATPEEMEEFEKQLEAIRNG